jgi:hypothetical protein
VDGHTNRRAEQRQLFSRRWPPRVCGNEQWTSTVAEQSQCEFRRGRCLPRTLEAEEQNARGSLAEIKLSP